MHARSNSADPRQCASCDGSGLSASAREADRVLALPEDKRLEAFGKLDDGARSRMFEANVDEYRRLSNETTQQAEQAAYGSGQS